MKNEITSMDQLFAESDGLVFRYQVYRRIFTPYEQQNASVFESCFESANYQFGYIEKLIPLGDSEWLIGFREIYEGLESGVVRFFKLSEIRLEIWDVDQEEEDE